MQVHPWDASLHLQRSYALKQLDRNAEAFIHQLQAIMLDPTIRWMRP